MVSARAIGARPRINGDSFGVLLDDRFQQNLAFPQIESEWLSGTAQGGKSINPFIQQKRTKARVPSG